MSNIFSNLLRPTIQLSNIARLFGVAFGTMMIAFGVVYPEIGRAPLEAKEAELKSASAAMKTAQFKLARTVAESARDQKLGTNSTEFKQATADIDAAIGRFDDVSEEYRVMRNKFYYRQDRCHTLAVVGLILAALGPVISYQRRRNALSGSNLETDISGKN